MARKTMLENAGLSFRVVPADIDERNFVESLEPKQRGIEYITKQLAQAKAQHVAALYPDALVIGSDQTLEFDRDILSKSLTLEEGKKVLRGLAGKTHRLYSCVCAVQGKNTVFMHIDHADLTMHNFDEDFLEAYAAKDTDALTSCVGGYKIEGAGAWLFECINGDYYTIMGMPLLPLLTFLRTKYKVLP
ncbi:MAG: Maf-like protein [Alphaproteobacteria bacterium]|nr:Maf-like protein [Alphaproteobacteria bacterium]